MPQAMLSLPSSARMRVHMVSQTLQPLAFATLCNLSSSVGGMLHMVTMAITSGNAHALEGIHEVWIDTTSHLQLSSGFEDYFLSAQYFDAGTFHGPLSGVTHLSPHFEPRKVSAYESHARSRSDHLLQGLCHALAKRLLRVGSVCAQGD